MKVVVTGAAGALARATISALAGDGHEVIAFAHGDLDVTDRGAVLGSVPPCDAIANMAAFTDVDGCERDPERAKAVNAEAVANLAEAARSLGACLLHVSTDYVFDGTKGVPYDERDAPAPLSVYGETKLAGEENARSAPHHLIVRTGFLFGTGRDHLSRSLASLASGGGAAAISDRVGSPTYVPDLAAAMVSLLAAEVRGLIHVSGLEPMTPHELLSRAARIAGFSETIGPQRAEDLDLPAQRPVNSALSSVRLHEKGVEKLPSIDDALVRLLREMDLPVGPVTTP